MVPRDSFKLVKGELKHHEATADSGNKVSRGFCPNCGSPIMSKSSGMPEYMELLAGSLDEPEKFKPMASIYVSSAPPWAPILEGVAKFAKTPG
jgi:hypothetical protein